MEATAAGALTRRGVFCPGHAASTAIRSEPWAAGTSKVSVRRLGGFADEGHLWYYASPARCGGMEEEKRMVKRRAKLVKGLAALQATAGGLGVLAFLGEAGERKMALTEAADVLLAQLELLRAEEKEMKRRKKEEKKAAMRAAAKQMEARDDDSEDSEDEQQEMKTDYEMEKKDSMSAAAKQRNGCSGCKDLNHKEMKRKEKEEKKAAMKAAAKKMKDCGECEDSSSSSSSESSDSDCEGEVMDMGSLRTIPANAESVTVPLQMETPKDELKSPTTVSRTEERAKADSALKCDSRCSSSVANGVGPNTSTSTCCMSSGKSTSPVVLAAQAAAPVERIEVCMGGKCKRSGAMELMQEFERRVGIEGAVVGCKCMGKCKEGPNVRVRNVYSAGDESEKVVRNPLCIGVGLDDVGTLVANFLAEKKDMGLLAA